jgi:type II restriction enzyme
MNLVLSRELGAGYTSPTQKVRVITERWALGNLYCPACDCDRLQDLPVNTPAVDLHCFECSQRYQLKSTRSWCPRKIVDAAYASMIEAIRSDRVPNLLLLHYDTAWSVRNLVLVPRFFFSESSVEQRRPLGPTARRAGWVGCNILLDQIPNDGKLPMVTDGVVIDSRQVRSEYRRVAPIAQVAPTARGWLLDVLQAVRSMGKTTFSLAEVYEHEAYLSALHPGNRNVRPKIRQQLQRLRDLGILQFVSPGVYRLLS